jgi:hypothetical protein
MNDWRAYLAATLSVIGSAGWMNSEIARLGAHNEDRAKETAMLQADVRELRGELFRCRGEK